MPEEKDEGKKFYFSAATRNLRLGDFQFDYRGMLVVDSAEEAKKVVDLLEAFGRGVTGAVSNLGNYNPYASIVEESSSSQGPEQTSQTFVVDKALTPSIADVQTGDNKPVVIGEIKKAVEPIVGLAMPKIPSAEDKDKAGV